jgi:hypothetical protein
MALIPHLDNTIRPALDRLNWWQDIVDEELRVRLQLCMGHPDFFASPHYGVVSDTDPAADLSGGTGNLAVSASSGTTTSVDVNPGMAVTKSGVWMRLSSIVRQIQLADPTPGIANVIYLAYGLQSATIQLNDWDEWVVPVSARYGTSPQLSGITGLLTQESSYVRVDKVTTYLSYSSAVTADFVPVAVATVQVIDSLGTTQLSIDHTHDNYDWNRPWFSMADIEHRSMQGTGVYSVNNPHSTSQNEVTAGNFTPFQLALNHGMVVSKDRSFEKIPGYRCEGKYLVDSLETDDGVGTSTGFPNAKFFRLGEYPVRIGKAWVTPSNEEVAALHVPGTTRIVFPGSQTLPAGETVHVYYTRTELCEPPVEGVVTFSTNNPAEGELLIAGGLAFETLASTEEAMSDSYQFPMAYQVYVDGEGSLRRTPQVVYCLKRLELVVAQDTFSISQYAPGKIMVGLSGAAPTLVEVKITVYGTNTAGANISNTYTFNNANWTPVTVGTAAIPVGSVQIGTDVFDSLTNYVVDNRDGDGPNSAIMIWCIQTPYDSYSKLKDAAHIADTIWDGLRLAVIRDRRSIETTEQVVLSADAGMDLFEFAVNQFAGGRQSHYREDFRRPTLHILEHPSTWATVAPWTTSALALKELPLWNFSKLQESLNGAYMTRALPVLGVSSFIWRVTFLPLRNEYGSNEFVAPTPRFRYKLTGAGWSAWKVMTAVPGMSSSYEFDVAADQSPAPPDPPVAVQLETDPYVHHSFVLYG